MNFKQKKPRREQPVAFFVFSLIKPPYPNSNRPAAPTHPRFWMTNFAACRTKRSFVARAHAIHETQSRAGTNRVGNQSVLSGYRTNRIQATHHPSDGQKIGEWNCGASIASGHSSTTLNSRCTLNSRASTSYTPNSIVSCHQHHCCSALSRPVKAYESKGYVSDKTSIISNDFLVRKEKCGLCKEPIKFFREEYVCGHAYHGECIWRFEKLNPTYDNNNCPKNCHRRPMIKRTRSIESQSSQSSASTSSSRSSSRSSSSSSSSSGSASGSE